MDVERLSQIAKSPSDGTPRNSAWHCERVCFGVLIGSPTSQFDRAAQAAGLAVDSAVFSEATIAALGLGAPVAADMQSAQEREIDSGHCHALLPSIWPRMARAKFARDAVMAEVLRLGDRGGGVVLVAGNGHVRHDIGVPRWLGTAKDRVFAVGYLENGDDSAPVAAFDAVVRTAVAQRADPCAEFERRAADK